MKKLALVYGLSDSELVDAAVKEGRVETSGGAYAFSAIVLYVILCILEPSL